MGAGFTGCARGSGQVAVTGAGGWVNRNLCRAMRLEARSDAELLEAKEAPGTVEHIGARVVRGAGREAKEVGVEFGELGPLVVPLAHGQELAELGGGEDGAKGGKAGELLGDAGAKVLRQEHGPVEGHVVSDQQRRRASDDVLRKLREGLIEGDAFLKSNLGRYALDRRRLLGDGEAVRTDDVIAVEVL